MTESQKKAKDGKRLYNDNYFNIHQWISRHYGNGIFNDGLYKGFVDSFNSKISERIKVEFTLEVLEELKQESPFPNYVPHQYINNKITELKNRIK